MSQPISYLAWSLVFLAFLIFGIGIWQACYYSIHNNPQLMPAFLATVVTIMTGVLATNLGAVIGIAGFKENSDLRDSKSWNPVKIFQPNSTATQILACYLYGSVLIIVLAVWWYEGFTEDPNNIVTIIPEIVKSFFGIAVGAVTSILNVKLNQ